MTDRRKLHRESRKAALIAAAQSRIESAGLRNLRARDVAADTGSALGEPQALVGAVRASDGGGKAAA